MDTGSPRLLLVVHERPGMRQAVRARLPGVPFAFLGELGRDNGEAVEAVLLGSIHREARTWEPSAHPHLRFVQRIFAGVDDVPFHRLPPQVEVAGNVGGYSPFVAEHALALTLAAARCVLAGHAAVASGRARPPPELRALWRETAVVLGFGAIGHAIAERLRPFEVRVLGLNRDGAPSEGADEVWPAGRLREALGQGRYVFDTRPLTRLTRGSLGAGEFAAMLEDATFVNVGRAGTVDEEALYRHLVSHPRFRAGLDVWWDEDLAHATVAARFPFTALPNFVGSPHWAGFSPHVEEYALATALENLARFFAGEPPEHRVDRSEYFD